MSNKFLAFLKKFNIPASLFVFMMSISGSFWIYCLTVEENLLSRRSLAIVLGSLFFFLFAFNRMITSIKKTEIPRKHLLKLLIPSFLLSVFFAAFIPGNLSFFQIRNISIETIPEKGKTVFEGINNGAKDISHSQLFLTGDWDYQDAQFSTNEKASIVWTGRSSNQISLTFQKGPEMGNARISWDGSVEERSFQADENSQIILYKTLPINIFIELIYFSVCTIFLTAFITLLLCFIISQPVPAVKKHRKGFWVKYSIPMIFTFSLMLMIYYPGIMSGDSLVQWTQAHEFQFSNNHPAFHSLMIWLITRIWDSPAAIVFSQFLFFSIVVSWGIGNLERRGMPPAIGWLTSILFAASPVNWLMVITLWKDIPYSVSLLWLTIILFEIYSTDGKWLESYKYSALLFVCLLLVSLFRHNGLLILILILILLFPLFWKQWKWSVIILILLCISRWLITSPGYKKLDVEPMSANYKYALILYHISAHIDQKSNLTDQQWKDIFELMPIECWEYSPCTVDPVAWNPQLDVAKINKNPIKYFQLAFELFLQDPLPDLKAVADIGSLVYSINPQCKTYISPLVYKPTANPPASWIDFTVDGIKGEQSKIPEFVAPLTKFFDRTFSFHSLSLLNFLFWRPAIYLISIILIFWIMYGIEKRWRLILIFCPAVFQSLILLLGNVAQDYRFQYGVFLIAEFLFGLLLFTIWKSFHNEGISL